LAYPGAHRGRQCAGPLCRGDHAATRRRVECECGVERCRLERGGDVSDPRASRCERSTRMKWVTRERARVDRIGCPWLISRFIDPAPEFLFVPDREVLAVAARESAVPYDVPNVELGHHGPRCSFDAFAARYELDDPALAALAPIVRGADTDAGRPAPEPP